MALRPVLVTKRGAIRHGGQEDSAVTCFVRTAPGVVRPRAADPEPELFAEAAQPEEWVAPGSPRN